MATQVRTWEDFVTAYTNSDVNEIEIMQDLDCNDNLPTSTITAKGNKIIINGNYHTIWNLSTGAVVAGPIIDAGNNRTITWNKVNFNNIYRIENYPIFNASASYNTVFNDCTFVCKCPNSLFTYATLNRCVVNFTGSTNLNPFVRVTCRYSWIHYEHERNRADSSGEFASIEGCYIEGKITTTLTSYTAQFPLSSYMSSNVINIETALPTYITSTTTTYPISVFNNEKLTNYTGTKPFIIGVSDAQMKDANYLSSIGFNIVT